MLRILAFSDIHNNLACVDKLVSQVSAKRFDCAVVAGDIGNKTAPVFFEKLSSLACPVHYIYGNWDSKLAYNSRFSHNSVHLHQNIQQVGGYFLVGFSGCPAHWGNNPIFLNRKAELERVHRVVLARQKQIKNNLRKLKLKFNKQQAAAELQQNEEYKREYKALCGLEASDEYKSYLQSKKTMSRRVLEENKQALFDLAATKDVDMRKLIVVTHERLAKLDRVLPEPPLLNMFGHIHTYSHKSWRGTSFINVSHLDNEPVSFAAKSKPASPGNFCEVTIKDDIVSSEKVDLLHSQ